MDLDIVYKNLIDALNLLSSNFNDQKKMFPHFVDIPFEILDSYQNAFMLLPELLEFNKINCKDLPNLLRLHNLINLELNNPNFELLNEDVICNSDEWNKIRLIANVLLLKMEGESPS